MAKTTPPPTAKPRAYWAQRDNVASSRSNLYMKSVSGDVFDAPTPRWLVHLISSNLQPPQVEHVDMTITCAAGQGALSSFIVCISVHAMRDRHVALKASISHKASQPKFVVVVVIVVVVMVVVVTVVVDTVVVVIVNVVVSVSVCVVVVSVVDVSVFVVVVSVFVVVVSVFVVVVSVVDVSVFDVVVAVVDVTVVDVSVFVVVVSVLVVEVSVSVFVDVSVCVEDVFVVDVAVVEVAVTVEVSKAMAPTLRSRLGPSSAIWCPSSPRDIAPWKTGSTCDGSV